MLYERTEGPVLPFHEDENGYIFRFFCGNDDPTPHEQSMPKGDKRQCCIGSDPGPNSEVEVKSFRRVAFDTAV